MEVEYTKVIIVGSRVKSKTKVGRKGLTNQIGTVCGIQSGLYQIEFDINIEGHECSGKCKDGYGWNVSKDDIKLL